MKEKVTQLLFFLVTCGAYLQANPYPYDYDYCPTCYYSPCGCEQIQPSQGQPCASVCGTNCGLSICSIAAAIAAVVGVAAIILSSPGTSTQHGHSHS